MSTEKTSLENESQPSSLGAVSSSYINVIKLADKIINGDNKTFGMIQCLDHYYNGAWDDDLAEFDKLKSNLGL